MFTEVKEKLKALEISPIFFVGSGLSRRYINSPDWLGLLKESMKDTEVNFKKYQQKHTLTNPITGENYIDLERLAEKLEEIYFDALSEDKLEEGKTQGYYYRKRIADIVSGYLEDNKEKLLKNEEVKELMKTTPAAIITTNYDEMLETIFGDEYTVKVGQTSLLTSVVDGVGDIYKIHGSVSDCNSIVISKKDYDRFFEKEVYLNSKILTLFLEYPIVFLGYSISDRNVKSILSTIFDTLSHDKVEELKSRMWFITRPNDGKDKVITKRINLNNGNYIDIKAFELNNFADFYKAISDISIKRLPIRFLKYLKHNTYQLIASQEYNPKLLNVNIEDIKGIKDFNEGNNFVGLTFSTKEKKVFSSVSEIIKVFIEGDNNYDVISVLGVVDEMYNKPIPFYKFLVSLNYKDILSEVIKRFGTNSRIYKRIINDDVNYKYYLGAEKENIKYDNSINIKNIEEYLIIYRDENGFYKNHENVIRRYIILYILNNRMEELLKSEEVINKYKDEITKAATNLSEEYIRNNYPNVVKLVEKLYNDNNTLEFKKLLCLIDRAVYRDKLI
ncbi:SIR2 family protein [Clostridium saudiense]|uniref:SIR2 family protein n=1 Tax=Clostridium saudiense TaxID=1414720 RepID=UPI0004B25A3A|nr:SIR2 family protein [Clostridium saudiense]